jgi:hypothetical protein
VTWNVAEFQLGEGVGADVKAVNVPTKANVEEGSELQRAPLGSTPTRKFEQYNRKVESSPTDRTNLLCGIMPVP